MTIIIKCGNCNTELHREDIPDDDHRRRTIFVRCPNAKEKDKYKPMTLKNKK